LDQKAKFTPRTKVHPQNYNFYEARKPTTQYYGEKPANNNCFAKSMEKRKIKNKNNINLS